jgi:hypothetical protein
VIALTVALSVWAFDLSGQGFKIDQGAEIWIEHNKLVLEPRPLGPVQVIDSRGRDVVVGIEGNVVRLKAKERNGFSCGVMTIVSGGEVFGFNIRPHPGMACVHPRY